MASFCYVPFGYLSSGIVRDIALGVRPYLLTSTLLSRGSIHPRTVFIVDHDQTSAIHLPIWTLRKVFTCPRTT